MTHYKSIVSTTLGVDGIGFINGTHGWVADDPESFAAAVISALSDAPERMRRAREARSWAEKKFSDQAVALELGSRLRVAKPLKPC
jgi:glycosyltransferase involved in cell wall biosynthesis